MCLEELKHFEAAAREEEARGQDSDDATQRDRSPHDARVSAEPPLPEAMAEDQRSRPPFVRVFRHEEPADSRAYTKGVEEERCHGQSVYALGGSSVVDGEVQKLLGVGPHAVEDRVVTLPVDEIRGRHPVAVQALCRDAIPDHRQSLGITIGQRPKQDRIEDAEESSASPDA